jgi:hypothetical protein
MAPCDRRKFLKMSSTGAATVIVGSIGWKKVQAKPGQTPEPAWDSSKQINPEIDNMRVVMSHDPEMVTGNPVSWTMEGQNEVVVSEKVYENMDKMAIALANKEVTDPDDVETNAANAWATIFRKPEGKEWSEVKVGLKQNTVSRNVAKTALIEKVCNELFNLGVLPANIYVYDTDGAWERNNVGEYYASNLPQGVQSTTTLGGDRVDVTLPDGRTVPCLPWLADDTIDILVNFALNKGHHRDLCGKFTLTVKNHLGSVQFEHRGGDSMDDMILPDCAAIYKSRQIMGDGNPFREQLCIVDSLWASNIGPSELPENSPHCLIMGTSGPIVDYLTVHKIRLNPEYMNTRIADDTNEPRLNLMMELFGYDPDSPELTELEMIDANTYESPIIVDVRKARALSSNSTKVTFAVTTPAKPARMTFDLPVTPGRLKAGIYTMKGRLIRSLALSGKTLYWDGKNRNGGRVRRGSYIIRLRAGRKVFSRKLSLL